MGREEDRVNKVEEKLYELEIGLADQERLTAEYGKDIREIKAGVRDLSKRISDAVTRTNSTASLSAQSLADQLKESNTRFENEREYNAKLQAREAELVKEIEKLKEDAKKCLVHTAPHLTKAIYLRIFRERERQELLKIQGKFKFTCADEAMTDHECYAVLGEEFGEVGKALNEAGDENMPELREELVQVAAVCVAWLEKLEQEYR